MLDFKNEDRVTPFTFDTCYGAKLHCVNPTFNLKKDLNTLFNTVQSLGKASMRLQQSDLANSGDSSSICCL